MAGLYSITDTRELTQKGVAEVAQTCTRKAGETEQRLTDTHFNKLNKDNKFYFDV